MKLEERTFGTPYSAINWAKNPNFLQQWKYMTKLYEMSVLHDLKE